MSGPTTSCIKPFLRSLSSGNDNKSVFVKAFKNKVAELIDNTFKWETI